MRTAGPQRGGGNTKLQGWDRGRTGVKRLRNGGLTCAIKELKDSDSVGADVRRYLPGNSIVAAFHILPSLAFSVFVFGGDPQGKWRVAVQSVKSRAAASSYYCVATERSFLYTNNRAVWLNNWHVAGTASCELQ